MKKLKQTKGITLVALVVTIIILLILAGISIQAITNTGIFTQANNAKRESEIASIKEQISLDIYEKQLVPPLGSITDEQLETILGKYGTVNKEDGTIVGITTGKGYEILLKDIYGGETVEESVPDGATVTPVNDITTWLKTAEISKQYSYTTIEQVIADSTCTQSLMNNENAMKYLVRSTEFANAICASETTMTYLGKSAYVDDTVLNSDIWCSAICDSTYFESVLCDKVPTMTSNTTPSGSISTINSNPEFKPYWAFDQNPNTGWVCYVNGKESAIGYKFDYPICVKKICALHIGSGYSDYPNIDLYFEGSVDGNSWNILASIKNSVAIPNFTMNIDNKNYYQYYRFHKPKNSSYGFSLNDAQLYGRTQK